MAMKAWIGPQKVGGVYYCGYWVQRYTVTAISFKPARISVRWDDGTESTHCTAWNSRDKVISQPGEGL